MIEHCSVRLCGPCQLVDQKHIKIVLVNLNDPHQMDAVGKLIRLFVDLIITFETPKLKLPNGKISSKIMPRPCNKDGWPDKNAINCMVFHYLIAVTAMDTCAKLNSGMDTNFYHNAQLCSSKGHVNG